MPEQLLEPEVENRFVGMHADADAKTPPGTVQLAQNFYLRDGSWIHRPGTKQFGNDNPATGADVQGLYNFEELDGTVHVLMFAGADMYEYNFGTDVWDVTDLSAQGVTVDASSPLSFTTSRGRLIVTDGVNQPWMWDGDSTFTVLSEAPIANGVTLYYDRVFFYDFPGSTALQFEWSNIGDPTDGYDADGQSWEFAQTDAGRVRGMAALNNTLVVLKEDSAAFLRGRVEDEFEADAVREGLSETEGTIAGRSVVVLDGDVFFLSQNGPRVAVGGINLIKLNEDGNGDDRLRDIWSTVDRANWSNSFGFVDTQKRHIRWFVPISGTTPMVTELVYAVDEGAWSTFTRDATTFDIKAAVEIEDTDGNERILLGRANSEVLEEDVDTYGDDGQAIDFILRSRFFQAESPMVFNRLGEARFHLNNPTGGAVDITVKPVRDGTVGSGSAVSVTTTGLIRYRKAFNAAAYSVGWQIENSTLGDAFDVLSAMTFIFQSGSYPTQ